MGVWGKIWRGKKKVRAEEEALLQGLMERRGDTVGSWTWSKGWVEEWICQGSGDVLRYIIYSALSEQRWMAVIGVGDPGG